jgi:hypothetical protein
VIISPQAVMVVSPDFSSTGFTSSFPSSPACSVDILSHRPLPPIPPNTRASSASIGSHVSFSSSTSGPLSYSCSSTSLFHVLPEIRSNPLWQQPLYILVEKIRHEFSLHSTFLTNIQVIEKACHETKIRPTRLYKVDAVKILIKLGVTVADL